MTMKSLLLGAAAGLVTVGAAQAADLPMTKAEPVEYVKVCSEFGAGFFYIPGSDTCLKISGEVRADYVVGQRHSYSDSNYDFRTRQRVEFDARTNTEYGTLRTFIRLQGEQRTNGDYWGNEAARSFTVDKGFIQFGGLTAGYAETMFGFYDADYGSPFYQSYFSAQHNTNLLAYTAAFGGGFTATVSVEDGKRARSEPFVYTVNATDVYQNHGARYPDVVGQLRIEQSWGKAAISGAIHDNSGYRVFDNAGVLQWDGDNKFGWAVAGSLAFNLPVLAGGWFVVEGTYARGASKYLGLGGSYSGTNGGVTIGDSDVYGLNGDQELGRGWAIAGELGVNFTPDLVGVLGGSYLNYKQYFPNTLPVTAASTLDSDTLKVWTVSASLMYTVVKGLKVGAEVDYENVDLGDSNVNFWGDDDDNIYGGLRIVRNF